MTADDETLYVRNPAVTETTLDNDVFLVEPGSGEVFYLNAVTSGLWTFFATPSREVDAAEAAPRQDVDELGQLVQAGLAEDIPDPGNARIAPGRLVHLAVVPLRGLRRLGAHRAKLVDGELLVVEPVALLLEQRRPGAGEPDHERDKQQQR